MKTNTGNRPKKTIVILSTYQLNSFLEFFKQNDHLRYVLIRSEHQHTDVDPQQAKLYFDAIYTVDYKKTSSILIEYDFEQTMRLINEERDLLLKNGGSIDDLTIRTEYEGNICLVARIRSQLGIEGLKDDKAIYFRDKDKMKKIVAQANLRVPKNQLIESSLVEENLKERYDELVKKLGLPFIVKPIESAGSDDVFRINCFEEFKHFFYGHFSTDKTFEAEEFIQGKLYHVDIVLNKGKPYFACACEYTWGNLELQYGKPLGSLFLLETDPNSRRLIRFVLDVLAAFGVSEGSYHTEVFITDENEMVFLETAARGPGLYINQMYIQSFGTCPVRVDLWAQIGEKPPISYPLQAKTHCFWVCLPYEAGKIVQLHEPALGSPYQINWFVKEGDVLGQGKSNLDISAVLFAENEDRNSIERDFEYIRHFKAMEVSSK